MGRYGQDLLQGSVGLQRRMRLRAHTARGSRRSSPRRSGAQTFTHAYVQLVHRSRPLAFKLDAYDLLAVMLHQAGDHQRMLLDELLATVATQFPLRSRGEAAASSAEFNTYLGCIDKLLSALSATGSVELLQVLASVFCREPGHVREEAMQAALGTMARRVDAAAVLIGAEWLYNMFRDTAYLSAQRKAAIQLMLVPLLHAAPEHVLVEFYCRHAADLIALVSSQLPPYVCAHAPCMHTAPPG